MTGKFSRRLRPCAPAPRLLTFIRAAHADFSNTSHEQEGRKVGRNAELEPSMMWLSPMSSGSARAVIGTGALAGLAPTGSGLARSTDPRFMIGRITHTV